MESNVPKVNVALNYLVWLRRGGAALSNPFGYFRFHSENLWV